MCRRAGAAGHRATDPARAFGAYDQGDLQVMRVRAMVRERTLARSTSRAGRRWNRVNAAS